MSHTHIHIYTYCGVRAGSHLPKILSNPQQHELGTIASPPLATTASGPFPDPPIWKEVAKFLRNPRKPVILAMSRPDSKKNVAALLHAYGSSNVLRELANLVLILVGA